MDREKIIKEMEAILEQEQIKIANTVEEFAKLQKVGIARCNAEALYNANCQVIPEGAVVLTKEECDSKVILDEDLPQKALFPNPCTKEKEAFETIIFQNRDNGYISDAYRNDIDVVCKGLNILHALQNKLENNTLYRVFPFETAKEIETYLKKDEDIKEWLE